MTDSVAQKSIVVHNYYYAKSGKIEDVFRWRCHACDVREQLGFARGRVLRGLDNGADMPDVIWECEYPNLAAREEDAKAVAATSEFQAVMAHMRTLLKRFERAIWEAQF